MAYSQGIDLTTNTSRCTGYTGYFESALFQIGTPSSKKLSSEIDFSLVEPLSTGQGIKLKCRTSLSASWTTIGTYDFATYGAIQGLTRPMTIPVPVSEYLQIRVELTTGASSNTSPKLRAIIVT